MSISVPIHALLTLHRGFHRTTHGQMCTWIHVLRPPRQRNLQKESCKRHCASSKCRVSVGLGLGLGAAVGLGLGVSGGLGLGASSGLELNSSSGLELNSSGGLGLDASAVGQYK